jgi:hypothetical protein
LIYPTLKGVAVDGISTGYQREEKWHVPDHREKILGQREKEAGNRALQDAGIPARVAEGAF